MFSTIAGATVFLELAAANLAAQSIYATLTGVVSDPSQDRLAGVHVGGAGVGTRTASYVSSGA
jgi:hypothetical protein